MAQKRGGDLSLWLVSDMQPRKVEKGEKQNVQQTESATAWGETREHKILKKWRTLSDFMLHMGEI